MCGIVGYNNNFVSMSTSEVEDTLASNYTTGHWTNCENINKHKYSPDLKHSANRNKGSKMNILNFVQKENYYVLVDKIFQEILKTKIINYSKMAQLIGTSRITMSRILNVENYWIHLLDIVNICKLLRISNRKLTKNVLKIKTKNSFPTAIKYFNLNRQLARVLGHILGDGGIHIIKAENKYRAFYVNNDRHLLARFKSDITHLFGDVKIYFREREEHGDEFWLSSTIGYIFYKLLEYDKYTEKRVPSIIKDSYDHNIYSAFLQALYDDEGSVYPTKYMVIIGLANYNLLNDIRELIIKMGIKPNNILICKSKTRTTMYTFSITSRENIYNFRERINFSHPTKRKKLTKLLKRYKNR